MVRRRAIWLPLTTALVAALIIGMTFWQGLQRGMHHAVAFGPESEQTAIAIALSETVYGLDLGYVGHASVVNALREVWNRGATFSHDPILVKNSNDRDLMNAAIATAAGLPEQKGGFFSDRSLISGVYDDLGYVDFIKMAFAVFGQKIEAMYHLFFTVLTISAMAFLICFRDRAFPQLILLLTLFTYLIELHTELFHSGMPTFTGMRHSSSLAMLPTWHLALALVYRQRATAINLAAALIQVAILVLALRIRGSVLWSPLFLVTLSCVLAWKWRHGQDLAAVARSAARWPVVMLLALIAMQAVYSRAKLHPIYFTDDVMAEHGLWHSAYLGLTIEPRILSESVQKYIAKGGVGDAIGAVAAMDYLQRTGFMAAPIGDPVELPPGYMSPWTNTVKFRLHDKIMQRVVIEAILHHPFRALKAYAIDKPVVTFQIFAKYVFTWAFFGLILLAGLVSYYAVRSNRLAGEPLPEMLIATGLAIVFSALPSLWTYPGVSSIVDLLFVLAVVVPIAGAIACHNLFRRLPALLARKT